MNKKNIIKNKFPTPSVSTNKKTASKLREDYKKLTIQQQLDHDLKNIKAAEKLLKTTVRNKGYSSKLFNKIVNKDLENYDPSISTLKNTRYHGKDILSIRINQNKYSQYNRKFTIDDIQTLSDKFSQDLKKNNIEGSIMTSLKYGKLNWKSGYMRDIGENVKMYDPNELYKLDVPYEIPDSIPSFNLYIALGSKKAMGGDDDDHNDCLYKCLKYHIFNIEEYFKNPAGLKKFLNLGRNDKIHVDHIDTIEKKLKDFKINIRGDVVRTSLMNSNKEINLLLVNEHYTVDKIKRNLLPALRIKFEEKTIILCDKLTLECYDGNKKWTMTKDEKRTIFYNPKSPYIIVDREDQGKDEQGNKIVLTIEEEFDQYIKISDALKKESKGMINLYKTGNYNDTVLNLFDRLTKFLNPEPILQDEAIFIKLSTYAAIISFRPYTGTLYKYDYKSFYPHLMTSSTNRFPVKRGEFKIISDFNKDYIEYGIYRCIIEHSEDETINNIFRFNYHNYYTNLDIETARKLNLKVTLIQDNKPNFLYYSRDKLTTMSQLFNDYISIVFPIKDNSKLDKCIRNAAKAILNRLWGCLCEVDKHKHYIDDNKFSMDDDEEIIELYPSNTETDDSKEAHVIKTTKINSYYKTDFARIAPFIISYGRRQMTNIMHEHKQHIYRVQTDGFYSNILIHSNTDVKLGELKYEGYNENAELKNKTHRIEVHY